MCPTSDGFDAGPREPKKRTSPGSIEARSMRAAFGTSPLMAYVVRPRSTAARAGASGYGSSLYTRQTNPEQSNPPGTVTVLPGAVALQSFCVCSDIPAKTYGEPTKRSARARTSRWSSVSVGTEKRVTRSWIAVMRPASSRRSFASEYAASAREAGCFGERSSSSLPCGWFTRNPSRRATVSVPSMSVGPRPASRAARRIVRAAGSRPAAATSCASSSRIVTMRVGSVGGRCCLPRATIAACSSSRVSGSSGLNPTTLGPITPARTTEAICGAAQLGDEDCVAAAAVTAGAGSAAPAVAVAVSAASEPASAHSSRLPPPIPTPIGRRFGGLDRGPADANGIRTFHPEARSGRTSRMARETIRDWVRSVERAEPDEQWAMLCFFAGRRVTLDEDEPNAAVRRAELLLAAGGDPRRRLNPFGRAATALADDLDAPERRAQLLSGLEALVPEVEGL